MISDELTEALGKHGWKPTFDPMKGPASYDGTGSLKGRASIYRKKGKRGGKGPFVLKLDGKEHLMGKRASFPDADAIVRRELREDSNVSPRIADLRPGMKLKVYRKAVYHDPGRPPAERESVKVIDRVSTSEDSLGRSVTMIRVKGSAKERVFRVSGPNGRAEYMSGDRVRYVITGTA